MRLHRGSQNVYHVGFQGTLTLRQQTIAGWDPTSIAGCVLWLDASQLTGLSDSDPVATWPDLSDGNDAVQATGSLQPLYKTGIQNSLPIVRFDGTDDKMQCGASCFSGAGARTIVVVYYAAGTVPEGAIDPVCGQSNGEGPANTWCVIQSRASPQGDPYIAGYANDLGGPVIDNLWKIATLTFDGTTATSFKNGGQEATGDKSAWNTADIGFQLGVDTGVVNQFLKGDIAEVVVYNAAISAADRATLETWLSDKWDIALV